MFIQQRLDFSVPKAVHINEYGNVSITYTCVAHFDTFGTLS
jgi:hypothetical protein